MKINFVPQRREERLSVEVRGDKIRINGELFNFGPVKEGDVIERGSAPCEWIASEVTRKDGEVELTLILPFRYGAGEDATNPAPVFIMSDGPVFIPGQEEEVSENVDA